MFPVLKSKIFVYVSTSKFVTVGIGQFPHGQLPPVNYSPPIAPKTMTPRTICPCSNWSTDNCTLRQQPHIQLAPSNFPLYQFIPVNCPLSLNCRPLDKLVKGTVKLKKHWQMIPYVFQKYPEKFTFQLFIILPVKFAIFLNSSLLLTFSIVFPVYKKNFRLQ